MILHLRRLFDLHIPFVGQSTEPGAHVVKKEGRSPRILPYSKVTVSAAFSAGCPRSSPKTKQVGEMPAKRFVACPCSDAPFRRLIPASTLPHHATLDHPYGCVISLIKVPCPPIQKGFKTGLWILLIGLALAPPQWHAPPMEKQDRQKGHKIRRTEESGSNTPQKA